MWRVCRVCEKAARPPRIGESIALHLAKRYSMIPATFDAMLASQGGKCANPGCLADSPQRRGSFQVDHDHSCCPGYTSCGKCVRGLLCGPCNRLLGQARDSIAVLSGAITYLSHSLPGAST